MFRLDPHYHVHECHHSFQVELVGAGNQRNDLDCVLNLHLRQILHSFQLRNHV